VDFDCIFLAMIFKHVKINNYLTTVQKDIMYY